MGDEFSSGDVKVVGVGEKRVDSSPSRSETKVFGVDEKRYDAPPSLNENWEAPSEWIQRLLAEYTGEHSGQSETLPAGADPNRVVAAIMTLNEEESIKVLKSLIEYHQEDYTIDHILINRCKELIEGNSA